MDDRGRIRAFGSEAVLSVARRGSAMQLIRPFTEQRIRDKVAAESYLRWVLDCAGGSIPKATMAVLLPPQPTAPPTQWHHFSRSLPFPVVAVCRPLAVTAGMGVEVASGACLVVIVDAGGVEVAVVSNGEVLLASRGEGSSPEQVAEMVRSSLLQVDPDIEWDVEGDGIRVVGDLDEAWAARLAELTDTPVILADPLVMYEGARRSVEAIRRSSAGAPTLKTLLRGVLVGFER